MQVYRVYSIQVYRYTGIQGYLHRRGWPLPAATGQTDNFTSSERGALLG